MVLHIVPVLRIVFRFLKLPLLRFPALSVSHNLYFSYNMKFIRSIFRNNRGKCLIYL